MAAIDTVNLSAEQQTLLATIPDPMFRQTTRDFCVNQQFRKDYWVKDARILRKLEQTESMLLSATGAILAVQGDAEAAKAKKACERINTHLMQKARASNEITYLASPVTGGGITVTRFQQLFLLARQQGHQQPADWAQFVWTILAAQGQRLVKEGTTLESAEHNLAELTAQAQVFADKQLVIFKALQLA